MAVNFVMNRIISILRIYQLLTYLPDLISYIIYYYYYYHCYILSYNSDNNIIIATPFLLLPFLHILFITKATTEDQFGANLGVRNYVTERLHKNYLFSI